MVLVLVAEEDVGGSKDDEVRKRLTITNKERRSLQAAYLSFQPVYTSNGATKQPRLLVSRRFWDQTEEQARESSKKATDLASDRKNGSVILGARQRSCQINRE